MLPAAQLNGRSSVLRCSLGMALAKMGQRSEALAQLEAAIAADPGNPLARFERAGVLLGAERFQEALAELAALRVRRGCPPCFYAMIPLLAIRLLHAPKPGSCKHPHQALCIFQQA